MPSMVLCQDILEEKAVPKFPNLGLLRGANNQIDESADE